MKKDNFNLDAELLFGGDVFFVNLINEIKNAKKSILINTFIWRDDKIGNIVANEILNAADRGVEIQIYKDRASEYLEKNEGSKQSFFNKDLDKVYGVTSLLKDVMSPVVENFKGAKQKENKLSNEIRNYSNIELKVDKIRGDNAKYYIFDDETLFVGGIDIEDCAIYHDKDKHMHHNYMMKINGKENVDKFLNLYFDYKPTNDKQLDFIFDSNDTLKLLDQAEKSVDILMPCIQDKDITKKIIELSKKGIKINLLMSKYNSNKSKNSLKMIKQILDESNRKVNIHLSDDYIDTKMLIIDGEILTFGSIDFNKKPNWESTDLNVVLNNYDDKINQVLVSSLKKMLIESKHIRYIEDINNKVVKNK